jgi:hypothetical protein
VDRKDSGNQSINPIRHKPVHDGAGQKRPKEAKKTKFLNGDTKIKKGGSPSQSGESLDGFF